MLFEGSCGTSARRKAYAVIFCRHSAKGKKGKIIAECKWHNTRYFLKLAAKSAVGLSVKIVFLDPKIGDMRLYVSEHSYSSFKMLLTIKKNCGTII
jgi:hypothetical protein